MILHTTTKTLQSIIRTSATPLWALASKVSGLPIWTPQVSMASMLTLTEVSLETASLDNDRYPLPSSLAEVPEEGALVAIPTMVTNASHQSTFTRMAKDREARILISRPWMLSRTQVRDHRARTQRRPLTCRWTKLKRLGCQALLSIPTVTSSWAKSLTWPTSHRTVTTYTLEWTLTVSTSSLLCSLVQPQSNSRSWESPLTNKRALRLQGNTQRRVAAPQQLALSVRHTPRCHSWTPRRSCRPTLQWGRQWDQHQMLQQTLIRPHTMTSRTNFGTASTPRQNSENIIFTHFLSII